MELARIPGALPGRLVVVLVGGVGPRQQPGEQLDDQRPHQAFVTQRHNGPLKTRLAIRRIDHDLGRIVGIDPVVGDQLGGGQQPRVAGGHDDGPDGGRPARHVDHDRRLLRGGNSDRDRVGEEELFPPAPGSHPRVFVSHHDANLIVLQRLHRVVGGHHEVAAVPHPDTGDSHLPSFPNRQIHRPGGDDRPDPVPAVHQGQPRLVIEDLERHAKPHQALFDHPDGVGNDRGALCVHPPQIRPQHAAGEHCCFLRRAAQRCGNARIHGGQLLNANNRHVACLLEGMSCRSWVSG